MASPVQIVLNPNNFSEDREKPGGGGPKTDFFLDDDIGFAAHRQSVLSQLQDVSTSLQRQAPAYGPVGFVKVVLRRRAWAKSHRPLHALFSERRTPLVGNLDLGELIVEATPQALAEIAGEVARAEDHAPRRLNERTKKIEAVPSPRRSERDRHVAPFDPSRDRHSRLVHFLETHPLVKRIELPGVVVRSGINPSGPTRSFDRRPNRDTVAPAWVGGRDQIAGTAVARHVMPWPAGRTIA